MLFSVFGSPIAHSLSPEIHQAFAKQFHLDLTYTKTACSALDFSRKLTEFKYVHHGVGANITAPLKQQAYALCQAQYLSSRAKLAQSVNTLYWDKNNDLVGDNTDGVGFERDIYDNAQQVFEHQNILIIGAGGAAAGILPIICAHQPRAIYLYNRTQLHAQVLAQKHQKVQVMPPNFKTLHWDWVINTAGQFDLLKGLNLDSKQVSAAKFYDLSYDKTRQTIFLEQAKKLFCPVWQRDGYGMLIEQAAESFYIWHHLKPDTKKLFRKGAHYD